MAKIKAISGITIAFLGLPIILVTFMAQSFWIDLIASTGIKISPWDSGGEVISSIIRDGYRIDVHESVFNTLLGPQEKGFVQLDWTPVKNLPDVIDEDVDYNRDGVPDFHIRWTTSPGEKAQLTALQPLVLGLQSDVQLEQTYVVRVDLKNPDFKK